MFIYNTSQLKSALSISKEMRIDCRTHRNLDNGSLRNRNLLLKSAVHAVVHATTAVTST